ncbi:MAG: efflux RND transporter periplasmic adaptor subunit [Acidiferrobacter sp.]
MAISRKQGAVIALLVLVVAGGVLYGLMRAPASHRTVTIYGNVDIRQVQAAFDDNGRIAHLLVQEGDLVKRGQLLANLDPVRFQDTVAKSQALVAAQQQVWARLVAGSRPEQIAEARAEQRTAWATFSNAKITWQRQKVLAAEQYVSQQSLDNARAALKAARAGLDHADQALRLAVRGPRKQDISAARHQLAADRATLALARRELTDTRLYASRNGVIEDRILEPGDMVTPQTPVFTLALTNPVWVRAYLPERALGQVQLGMTAWIDSNSFPGQPFRGWVGFISPTAEFTPKTIETTELRTELIYRVRVYACNPQGRLRLGMPVTVHIPLYGNPPQQRAAHPCGE